MRNMLKRFIFDIAREKIFDDALCLSLPISAQNSNENLWITIVLFGSSGKPKFKLASGIATNHPFHQSAFG
jgi:hypothetical protein